MSNVMEMQVRLRRSTMLTIDKPSAATRTANALKR
jgi:hypothetical protein